MPSQRRGSGSHPRAGAPTHGSRVSSVSRPRIRSRSVRPARFAAATPSPTYPPAHASPRATSIPPPGGPRPPAAPPGGRPAGRPADPPPPPPLGGGRAGGGKRLDRARARPGGGRGGGGGPGVAAGADPVRHPAPADRDPPVGRALR